MCETKSALSYYTDAHALLAYGTSYPSRSWKNTVVATDVLRLLDNNFSLMRLKQPMNVEYEI